MDREKGEEKEREREQSRTLPARVLFLSAQDPVVVCARGNDTFYELAPSGGCL